MQEIAGLLGLVIFLSLGRNAKAKSRPAGSVLLQVT
jgi:hypothetical protein